MFAADTRTSLRHVPFAIVLIVGAVACGDRAVAPGPSPDKVYITPIFVEAIREDLCCPQIGENGGSSLDWELVGTTLDRDGTWAPVGSTVILRVHSPLYQTLDLSLLIPDTVTPNAYSLRRYFPIVRVSRLVPAVLRVRWSADFTGPTLQVEIYAPHGISGVTLPYVWVYLQACLNGDPFCETRITGSADRPEWRPDSSATGEWAWANLSAGWPHLGGRWSEWPTALPPIGYGGPDSSRAWQATVSFSIEDDQGHHRHAGCSGGFIPSAERELDCSVLFSR